MGNGDEEGLQPLLEQARNTSDWSQAKKKAKGLFQYLSDKGTSDEDIARIKCPAGLELEAKHCPKSLSV